MEILQRKRMRRWSDRLTNMGMVLGTTGVAMAIEAEIGGFGLPANKETAFVFMGLGALSLLTGNDLDDRLEA